MFPVDAIPCPFSPPMPTAKSILFMVKRLSPVARESALPGVFMQTAVFSSRQTVSCLLACLQASVRNKRADQATEKRPRSGYMIQFAVENLRIARNLETLSTRIPEACFLSMPVAPQKPIL